MTLILTVAYMVNLYTDSGSVNVDVGNEKCKKITNSDPTILGCEDIARFPNNGPILVSCDDRSRYGEHLWAGLSYRQILSKVVPGKIYMMTSCQDQTMIPITVNGSPNSKDFHPHGLGVIVSSRNVHLVYLVNHRSDGDMVEIYEFQPEKHLLVWKQEISHKEYFTFLNDVQPVWRDPKSNLPDFYVTNSFKYEAMSWKNILLEGLIFRPKWTKLIYCGQSHDKNAPKKRSRPMGLHCGG